MHNYTLLCVVLLVVVQVYAFDNCYGTVNNLTIWNSEPVLLNATQNGKLYTAGAENPVYVLHVYGTPYDMGYAQGVLLKEQILNMYAQFWDYIDEQTADSPYFRYLPEHIRRIIETDGVTAALEYEVLMTAAFTPIHFNEEIRGLAEGLGLPYAEVRRFTMFPELIKAACSIMGAWGQATTDGGLIHLRALDWGTDNPFRKFPLLTVYHPLPGNGHTFAQLGWTGLLGALTGYSPFVGAGEKVWLAYNGTYVRDGIPWTYLFRDMLQYDETVEQAIHRINTSHRTCSVFLGLGDHGNGNFKVVEYSHDRVEVFGDNTPFPGYAPTPSQHPLFSDVVYVDKHMQPSKDPCMGSIISAFYGSIDAKSIISLVSLLQTGDMHAAIFDYKNNLMYVAVATQTVPLPSPTPAPVQPAYERQFIKFDMNALFKLM